MVSGTHEAQLLRSDGLQRWLHVPSRQELRKVLEPTLAMDGKLARSWLARAEANRNLRSAGCAEVLASGIDESGVWVTSRHVEGVTLATAMRAGVSTDLALYVADAILAALEAAHRLDLVHLDLDPEGIFVRGDGTLVLPEFGLWSALVPSELARLRFDARRVAYLAPELVQARPADARSDLFALGWLLYEWLGGRSPFAGESPLALATAIDLGKHVALAELAPRVPVEIGDVVEMLLQGDASCRFQAPGAARAALRAIARFDVVSARMELAGRASGRVAPPAQEPRTRIGLGLSSLFRSEAPPPALPPPAPPSLLANPFVAKPKAPDSALIAPPPLFLSGLALAEPALPEPSRSIAPPHMQAPPSRAPASQVRAPRARAVEGQPVHDGRTAFLRVESALRTVLPRKWQTAARTSAPRAVAGKWQDPSTTLFRVRRAALSGPVVRVASLPRVWWVASVLALGLPVIACVYLLIRLWF